MRAKKSRSILAGIITALTTAIIVLLLVFLMGRYGWKLGGFRVCESAGIHSVEVKENSVRLTGFNPGSFPEGFTAGQGQTEKQGRTYGACRCPIRKTEQKIAMERDRV